jgi:2-polyprenyl-3-methyl-5-hydroxy-6-metoxy-1,4-benzoquinol methylase
MFRTPTDDPADNQAFYENVYSERLATTLPGDHELAELKKSNFANSENNYAGYIDLIRGLGVEAGSRIFDFGCSWGYGSFQIAQAGFKVTSYEVALPRRRYAEKKLGIDCIDNMEQIGLEHLGNYDCFFLAHVLEHLPSPAKAFEYARALLKDDGVFLSVTPNGSQPFRQVCQSWSRLWGEVHPNAIDVEFLDYNFSHSPRAVGSMPTALTLPEEPTIAQMNSLDGYELAFAARRGGAHW